MDGVTPQTKIQRQGVKLIPSVRELRDTFQRLDYLFNNIERAPEVLPLGVSWLSWKQLDISSHALPHYFEEIKKTESLMGTLTPWPKRYGPMEKAIKRNQVKNPASVDQLLLKIAKGVATAIQTLQGIQAFKAEAKELLVVIFHGTKVLSHFFSREMVELLVDGLKIQDQEGWDNRNSLVKGLAPDLRVPMNTIQEALPPLQKFFCKFQDPLKEVPYLIPSPGDTLSSLEKIGKTFKVFDPGERQFRDSDRTLKRIRKDRMRNTFISHDLYKVVGYWSEVHQKVAPFWSDLPKSLTGLEGIESIRMLLRKTNLILIAVKWHIAYIDAQSHFGLVAFPEEDRTWPKAPIDWVKAIDERLKVQVEEALRELQKEEAQSKRDAEHLQNQITQWIDLLPEGIGKAFEELRQVLSELDSEEDGVLIKKQTLSSGRQALLELRSLLDEIPTQEDSSKMLKEIGEIARFSNGENSLWSYLGYEAQRNEEVESALREMMYILNVCYERKVFDALAGALDKEQYTTEQLALFPYGVPKH